MVFFNIYVLAIFIGFILLLILIISGAILIYSGRARINRRNIFILIIYRLVQLLLFINVISIFLLVLSQIFSIKFYSIDHKTGSSYGWLNQADGYEIPATVSYSVPKQQVYIKVKVGSEVQSFSQNSLFSYIENQSIQFGDSLQYASNPLIFGKNHAPYLSTDTIWNKINIDFPVSQSHPMLYYSIEHRRFPVIKRYQVPDHGPAFHIVPPGRLNTEVYVRSDKPWENFIFSLFTYLKLFAWLTVLFFLAKILSSFRKEQLFAQRHFAYVGFIGLTLVFYQILRFILSFICNRWIISCVFIHGTSNMPGYIPNISASLNIIYDINFPLLISGFLIILVAQVFKEGFVLQKEQELTI